jgi:hypothetical protein
LAWLGQGWALGSVKRKVNERGKSEKGLVREKREEMLAGQRSELVTAVVDPQQDQRSNLLPHSYYSFFLFLFFLLSSLV